MKRKWSFTGGKEEKLRLIEFIDPSAEVLKPILKQAEQKLKDLTSSREGKAFDELCAYVAPPDFLRYGNLDDYVRCQIEAVYEALRSREIGYALERWDSQPTAQVIRTHKEMLDSEEIGGTCIDLVVLMAACLEVIGIQALVVIIENQGERHAILGYRLREQRYGRETQAEEMPHILSEQQLHRLTASEAVEFVNCTGITRGENVDFKQARKQGWDYLEGWKLLFALDVKAARRTVLTRQMLEYLEGVKDDALTLPPAFGFPPNSSFPKIRVQVKVRKGHRRYSEAEANALEMSRRQAYADEELMIKAYQYPWPLAEDREREAERALDWDLEGRKRFKRTVILGDPGFGKTWLLKHEAWNLAEHAMVKLKKQLKKYPFAEADFQLPIFLPLAQLATQIDRQEQAAPIEKALVAASQKRYPVGKSLKEWMWNNINSEQCVLLLDALDEVPADQKENLCKLLDDFARKQVKPKILLTSRLVGYPGPPFPLGQEGEFELLPFDRYQERDFVRAWFARWPERGNLFLQKLKDSPQLKGLAGVPLLLALMCRLFVKREGLPKTRAELYAGCISGIIGQGWKTPRAEDPYSDARSELSEELGFALFAKGKELFSLRELRATVRSISQDPDRAYLKEDLKGKSSVDLVEELEEDGLLIRAGAGDNPPYLFLHLTFQEYLTACALRLRTSIVELDGTKMPEWLKIVKPRLFDPRWEEVIRLLAGKLEDATPLIQAIWEEPEDLFLDRLILAGECLVDARSVSTRMRKRIVEKVIDLAKKIAKSDSENRMNQLTFSNLLMIEFTWERFTALLGMLAASHECVLRQLVQMIEDPVFDTRFVVRILARTRADEVVPALIPLLKDSDRDVRLGAAEALRKIGSEEAVPALITVLKEDSDRDVRQ
jgi:hypothetical protein